MLNAIWAFAGLAGSAMRRATDWLKSLNGWQLLCLVLALFAGVQTVRVTSEQRHSVKLQSQLSKCSEARETDRSAYEAAQAEAQRQNLESVRSKEAKQQRLNDAQVSTLSTRLELLRSELRKTGTPEGHPGGSGSPQAGGGPSASGEARVCLEAKDFLRGAENEERHDELITLVEQLIKLTNEE